MVHIMQADLRGKLQDFGPLKFLRVEWWDEAPRMALLRYSLGENEEALGIRLDLDKKAILDSVSNVLIDEAIRKDAGTIWQVVVSELLAELPRAKAVGEA